MLIGFKSSNLCSVYGAEFLILMRLFLAAVTVTRMGRDPRQRTLQLVLAGEGGARSRGPGWLDVTSSARPRAIGHGLCPLGTEPPDLLSNLRLCVGFWYKGRRLCQKAEIHSSEARWNHMTSRFELKQRA